MTPVHVPTTGSNDTADRLQSTLQRSYDTICTASCIAMRIASHAHLMVRRRYVATVVRVRQRLVRTDLDARVAWVRLACRLFCATGSAARGSPCHKLCMTCYMM